MLFMRYYIYNCELHDKPIIRDFVNKILLKYKIENKPSSNILSFF